MKKILSLLLLLTVGIGVSEAQKLSSSEKKAREQFIQIHQNQKLDPKEKIKALKEVLQLNNKLIEAYWVLADSYKAIKDEVNYVYYLERAERMIKIDKEKSLDRFLDKTYLRLGKAYYETGQYEKSKTAFESNPVKYKDWIKRCDDAIVIKKNPVPFTPVNLVNVNTDYDDYWPCITADGLNISTTVNVISSNNGAFAAQEDMYHSQLNSTTGNWSKSKPIGPPTNTDQNEGAQNFSVDGRYLFFVACNRPNGKGSCDIYYSIKTGDSWGKQIPADGINSIHQETTPSFSPTGEELFFASNRPGGVGDLDIWVSKVTINEDGTLSFATPKNLGAPINTRSNEISPFIHVDNQTLYFSSEGHPGLGINDVFFSKRDNSGIWSMPKNIGYPINTHRDEIGFTVNAQGKKAYISSDGIQQNNGRRKDIYEIDLPEEARPTEMEFFNGTVIDAKTRKPLQARVEVFQLEDNKVIFQSVSDEETGEFQAFLPPDKEYGFTISKRDYMFYSGDVADTQSKEHPLTPIAVGEKVVLNNIFFDFDQATLQPKSIAELERVLTFMRQNPQVRIELGGHTDDKGSDEYNQTLSENRAKVTAEKLIELGVHPVKISYKGYGESMPVATNETDEGRAQNRRTEIIIKEIKK